MYEELLAERLAKLREEKNISAREMSLSIGQNASYINRIENKQALPSMQGFFYICEYLTVTPEEFFAMEKDNPKEIQNFLDDIKRLNADDFSLVKMIIKALIC